MQGAVSSPSSMAAQVKYIVQLLCCFDDTE